MADGLSIDLEALTSVLAGSKDAAGVRLAPQQPGDKPALAYSPETGQLHSTADPGRVAALDPQFLAWIQATIQATSKPATAAPAPAAAADQAPRSYHYKYDVTDGDGDGATPAAAEPAGQVQGSYYVLLPDNRLMTVSYQVDGESGFVPQITFQDNWSPL
ncbi:chitin-binding domain-containing protein [Kitasatospora sp. NPDC089509]|uniref:chitin-binding domain-containing protein n=1 Tax=Kitasatospora sp. NPDC089509 TaxID=3364079 RepID=UPI00382E08C1